MNARDNPKGHFEDRQFIKINNEILFRNGGNWHRPPKKIRIYPDLKMKMRGFIKQWDPQKITGFKDPRICLTFPFWYQVVNPEPVKVIMVVRPIFSIAKSLKKRNQIPLKKGVGLAEHYVKTAFSNVHRLNVPFMIAVYPRFLRTYQKEIDGKIRNIRNWRRELEPILKFTGLKIPKDPSVIDKFIDERLWHFRDEK